MAEWLADSWEDKAFADVDLTVVVADSSSASNDTKCTVLCKIAAHRLVLSRSPYLKAQVNAAHLCSWISVAATCWHQPPN